MTAARWLETDSLSNQNISSALAIGAYTADADRMIVCDVSMDQVAGAGDYVVYLTRQIGGAGSAYVMLPKTTCTAASGETAIAMQSGAVTVRSGDVLTCYVDGLAGDTTTPDTTVRWFELAALRPTTADRTLAVDANGYVVASNALDAAGTRSALGMAAANLDAQIDALPTAAEAASATRSELATELARIDVATSTRLATAGYTAPPAVGAIADAIADEPMAGHTTPGTAAAAWAAAAGDPWASDLVDGDYNDPDTAGYIIARLAGIDVSAVNLVATSNAGEITIKRTLNLVVVVSGLTIPADWTACYWTVKRSTDDLDADAMVQILVSNPGDPDDGVQVLMGTALEDESDGSLVVNQALGTVTIALGDASTALLDDAVELVWDIKVHTATGKTQPGAGTATITTAVTRA